jgi:hypothetical protein
MQFAKRLLMGVGAAALAAILGMAIAPRAAHGLVAALVQVTNTPTNPVNTLAADAATAFVAENTCSFVLDDNVCVVSPLYTVPAGQIAVTDSVAGYCMVDPGAGEEAVEFRLGYNSPSGAAVQASIAPGPVFQFPGLSAQASVGAANFRTYASSGPITVTAVTGNGESNASDFCRVTLSGHLVTP